MVRAASLRCARRSRGFFQPVTDPWCRKWLINQESHLLSGNKLNQKGPIDKVSSAS
jgi:hypothetical protein